MDQADTSSSPDSSNYYEWLLLSVIGFLTFVPLWTVGLASTDDMVYSQLGYTHDWDSPITNALGMGRFYYVYSGYLYMAPYLIKDFYYFKLFAIGPLVAIPFLLGGLLQRITGSPAANKLSILIYFVGLQMYTDYYPTAAFPFVFTFSVAVFLCSLNVWLAYLQSRRPLTLALSVLLFCLSILPYETFVVLFSTVTFLTAFFMTRAYHLSTFRSAVSSLYAMRFHLLALGVYVVLYVTVASLPAPEGYSRDHYKVNSSEFSLSGFVNTLWHFSTSSLPLASNGYATTVSLTHTYWDHPKQYTGIKSILRTAKPEWWVRAVLAGSLAVVILGRRPSISRQTAIALALTGSVVFVLSPFLHALTSKYQQWVANGVHVYLPTFFSFMGFVLLASAVILPLNQVFQRPRLFKVWLLAVGLGVGYVTIVHSANNYYITRYQSHHSFTWTVMDRVLESHVFQEIPDGAVIYTQTLPRATVSHDMLTHDVRDYWEGYINVVTGKSLRVVYSEEELRETDSNAPVYYLRLVKLPRQFDAYAVLAQVDFKEGSLPSTAASFYLMTYSRYKTANILFYETGDEDTLVEVEGQPPKPSKDGIFQTEIICPVIGPLTSTRVNGSKIDLDSVQWSP